MEVREAGLAVASPATRFPPWHPAHLAWVLSQSHWRTRFNSISTNFTSEVQLSRACALGRHGNRPNVEGVERRMAAFAYGVPSMPVGGRPKKGIEGVRPALPKCAPKIFDFLT